MPKESQGLNSLVNFSICIVCIWIIASHSSNTVQDLHPTPFMSPFMSPILYTENPCPRVTGRPGRPGWRAGWNETTWTSEKRTKNETSERGCSSLFILISNILKQLTDSSLTFKTHQQDVQFPHSFIPFTSVLHKENGEEFEEAAPSISLR